MTTYSSYSSTVSATTSALKYFSPTMPGQMHCYVLAPTVVFAARVNMATVSYPIDAITYDTDGNASAKRQPVTRCTLGAAARASTTARSTSRTTSISPFGMITVFGRRFPTSPQMARSTRIAT